MVEEVTFSHVQSCNVLFSRPAISRSLSTATAQSRAEIYRGGVRLNSGPDLHRQGGVRQDLDRRVDVQPTPLVLAADDCPGSAPR